MQGNIAKTAVSKGLIAIGNFIILILTTQFLGADVRGEIALLVLAVSITALVSQLIGGPAMVYLLKEKTASAMLFPALLWSILSAMAVNSIFLSFSLMPYYLFIPAVIISFIHSIGLIFSFILLGKQHIKVYNMILMLQTAITILVLLGLIYVSQTDRNAFFYALGCAYAISSLIAFLAIWPTITKRLLGFNFKLFKQMFTYGIITQTANLAHLFSNRISYFVLEAFAGFNVLGIFSAGSSVSETTLIFSTSASLIMYSKISNTGKTWSNQKETLLWAKLSFIITALTFTVFACLPESFYQTLLGKEFGEARLVVIGLSIGISFLSATSLIAHYFSGTGKFKISTYTSLISFIIIGILIYPMVNAWGMLGAAIATSIGFSISCFYIFFRFRKEYPFSLRELLLSKSDFRLLSNEIKHLFSKTSN